MPAFLGWQALGEECSPNYSHELGSLSSLPFQTGTTKSCLGLTLLSEDCFALIDQFKETRAVCYKCTFGSTCSSFN